jgi:hypothetical protein
MSSGAAWAAVEAEAAADKLMLCANCGIAQVDDIKLEECDGCDLVKYCSDKCSEEHQEQHEEECKKRKAELHDRKLFTQPENLHFIHAAANRCAMVVFGPISFVVETTIVHSAESRR